MKPSVALTKGSTDTVAVSSSSSSNNNTATATDKLQLNKQSCSSAWLEHYTDNVGVSSSNLLGTTKGE